MTVSQLVANNLVTIKHGVHSILVNQTLSFTFSHHQLFFRI